MARKGQRKRRTTAQQNGKQNLMENGADQPTNGRRTRASGQSVRKTTTKRRRRGGGVSKRASSAGVSTGAGNGGATGTGGNIGMMNLGAQIGALCARAQSQGITRQQFQTIAERAWL